MNQLTFRLVPKLENEEHEPRILQLSCWTKCWKQKKYPWNHWKHNLPTLGFMYLYVPHFQQFHISQKFLQLDLSIRHTLPFNLRLLARLVCTRCTLCSSNWWWLGAVHYVPREESLGTNCEWNDILGGGFKHFLFSPPFGEDSHFDFWLIFFKWVETTN